MPCENAQKLLRNFIKDKTKRNLKLTRTNISIIIIENIIEILFP